jgi:hypothetical protein
VWEGVINTGSSWFRVNYQAASVTLRDVYKKYKNYLSNSKKSVQEIETRWSFDAMTTKFEQQLTQYLPKFAQKIQLNLPKLKKVE